MSRFVEKAFIAEEDGSSSVFSLPLSWSGGNFWGLPPIRGIKR